MESKPPSPLFRKLKKTLASRYERLKVFFRRRIRPKWLPPSFGGLEDIGLLMGAFRRSLWIGIRSKLSSWIRRLKKTLAYRYERLQVFFRQRIRPKLSSWFRRIEKTLAFCYKIIKWTWAFNPWKCLLVFSFLGPILVHFYDYSRRLIISKNLYWAVGSSPLASRGGEKLIIESMIRWKIEALPPGFPDKWLNLGNGFALTPDEIKEFLKSNFKVTKPSRWAVLFVAFLFSVKFKLLPANFSCYRRWATVEKDHMEIHAEQALACAKTPSWVPTDTLELTRNHIIDFCLIITVVLFLLCLKLWVQVGLITTLVVLYMCGYSTPFLLVVPLWFILMVVIHRSFFLSDELLILAKWLWKAFKRWLGRP